LKEFTFRDGTRVKQGDWVSIPVGPMLRDERLYPQPDEFNGFRYTSKLMQDETNTVRQPEGPSKFTDINEKWQVWGVGKITWYV
jgi:cytochrome P450